MEVIRAGELALIQGGVAMRQAFIGVDVGTSRARAGIFDEKGSLLATRAPSDHGFGMRRGSVVEQSSSEIWAAGTASVRAAMAEAAIPALRGQGSRIRCDCSLVVLDAGANPLR